MVEGLSFSKGHFITVESHFTPKVEIIPKKVSLGTNKATLFSFEVLIQIYKYIYNDTDIVR